MYKTQIFPQKIIWTLILTLQKENKELLRLVNIDCLTRIANRRRFDERLIQEWQRGRRSQQPLSLIMGDVDYF